MENSYRTEDPAEILAREVANLSAEEKQLLIKCVNEEGTIKSAIPTAGFAAIFGYGIGYVSPFRKYAKHFALFSGTMGFLTGRALYGIVCIEKHIPRLRYLLKRKGSAPSDFGVEQYNEDSQSFQSLPLQSADESSIVDFGDPIRNYDTSLNYSRDTNTTSEDIETDLTEPINLQPSISYADLRQKNRAEYQKKLQRNYTFSKPEKPPVQQQELDNEEVVSTPQNKNKYGDVWG